MIYISVLITGLTFSTLRPKSKIFFNSYLLLLLILASFRYGVGPDYFAYEELYLLVGNGVFETVTVELLFKYYGAVLHYLNFSYQQYVALTALITLYFIGKTCKKYSQYPVLSLYLYFCFFYLVWVYSGLRQGLTLAIGVYYLLECLENHKHTKFVLIVFFLSLIHASSLILLLFYIVGNLNLKREIILLTVLCGFFLSLVPGTYLMAVLNYFPYGERINFYFRPVLGLIVIDYFDFKSIARMILLLTVGVVFSKIYNKSNEIERKIVDIYLISFAVYFALRFVEILAANASIYGFVLLVIVIPNIYARLKNKLNARLFLVGSVIFSLAFFFKNLDSMEDYSNLTHSSLITPYTHVFNKSDYTFPSRP